jgi:hypothetical protein
VKDSWYAWPLILNDVQIVFLAENPPGHQIDLYQKTQPRHLFSIRLLQGLLILPAVSDTRHWSIVGALTAIKANAQVENSRLLV